MNNIGQIYHSKGDYDTALRYLKQSLAIRQQIPDILGEAETKTNMGVIFFKQSRYEEAIPLLVQAYDIFQKIGSRHVQAAKAITEHIREGQPYAAVKKVISITIAYFDLGQGQDYVYHGTTVFKGIHKNDVLLLADKQIELYRRKDAHEIFPEFWVIKVGKFSNRVKDTLDEWIYFFKNAEIKSDFSAKGLKEAGERLAEMKLNEQDAKEYKKYLKKLRDIASDQHTKIADAQEFIKKGKVEVAQNLKNMGFSHADIKKATELTDADLERL